MSQYIQKFRLVSDFVDTKFVENIRKTCYSTFYPFNMFPDKELYEIEFEPITIFYGGNGSGKTTLLNLIAQRLNVARSTPFNGSAFFDDYVDRCEAVNREIPEGSKVLTSDDVFDYVIDIRHINNGIDKKREELLDDFYIIKSDQEPNLLESLDKYREWKEKGTVRSGKLSGSQYVRDRMINNIDMKSNGQSAIKYFLEEIEEDALYLLDEPENSLSIEYQLRLKTFLEDSARYFGCQLIITTHSPILLSMKGAKIYDLDEFPVKVKPWTELENVRKYFEFFEEHRNEFI